MAFLMVLAVPLFALFGAGTAALLLFWPVMLLMGALHNQVGFEWVPAPGWQTTMLIVGLLYLLVPHGTVNATSN